MMCISGKFVFNQVAVAAAKPTTPKAKKRKRSQSRKTKRPRKRRQAAPTPPPAPVAGVGVEVAAGAARGRGVPVRQVRQDAVLQHQRGQPVVQHGHGLDTLLRLLLLQGLPVRLHGPRLRPRRRRHGQPGPLRLRRLGGLHVRHGALLLQSTQPVQHLQQLRRVPRRDLGHVRGQGVRVDRGRGDVRGGRGAGGLVGHDRVHR